MTVETPQPRDRVRWQRTHVIEGVVEEITSDGLHIRAEDGRLHLCQVEDATVEVLERADDPSKDLTGSIRHTGTITCIARERDGGPDYHRWIAVELNESFMDEHMRGSKVIGAVPGTPAAEAQQIADALPDWERELIEKESPARPSVRVENETLGPRLLRVHPHVWQSLTHYLASTRIRVTAPDGDGVWGMELMDGEWT